MALVDAEWGLAGVEALRARVGVLVIVDVLSFSTAVDVAVSRGALIYPFAYADAAAARHRADQVGATLALPRRAAGGQFSLSPTSLAAIAPGTRLVLPSPNGSRLSLAGGQTPVLAGCLRNAAAVARQALTVADGRAVGVVPAGELWHDGGLRPGIEDWLGAGAVIHHLGLACSPEAELARDAFRGADVPRLVRDCRSGQELIQGGFPDDVALAVALGVSSHAPMLIDGAYRQTDQATGSSA